MTTTQARGGPVDALADIGSGARPKQSGAVYRNGGGTFEPTLEISNTATVWRSIEGAH